MAYAALAISVMALLFTSGTFWWLNARQTALRCYEPTTWAAGLKRERAHIRLPLVLHNPGAVPVVVLAMRLRFIEDDTVLKWEWTRSTVQPKEGDVRDVAQPVSVPPRTVLELVPEFKGVLPGVLPELRAHPLVVEAITSRGRGWELLLESHLQFKNFLHPLSYIAYTNDPDYLTEQQLAQGAEEHARLRKLWSLPEVQQVPSAARVVRDDDVAGDPS